MICWALVRRIDPPIRLRNVRKTYSPKWTKTTTDNWPRTSFWRDVYRTKNCRKCWRHKCNNHTHSFHTLERIYIIIIIMCWYGHRLIIYGWYYLGKHKLIIHCKLSGSAKCRGGRGVVDANIITIFNAANARLLLMQDIDSKSIGCPTHIHSKMFWSYDSWVIFKYYIKLYIYNSVAIIPPYPNCSIQSPSFLTDDWPMLTTVFFVIHCLSIGWQTLFVPFIDLPLWIIIPDLTGLWYKGVGGIEGEDVTAEKTSVIIRKL